MNGPDELVQLPDCEEVDLAAALEITPCQTEWCTARRRIRVDQHNPIHKPDGRLIYSDCGDKDGPYYGYHANRIERARKVKT